MTRRSPPATCFVEQDPYLALGRRATAEGVGTFLLVLIVAGAGLAAKSLGHGDPLVGLLGSAIATASALTGLIVALGAVSGGHFNPLITVLQWLAGERSLGCMLAYAAAQLAGAVAGAVLASIVFAVSAHPVAHLAVNPGMVIGEALATAGLLLVVFGCSRSGRRETGPFAVGAWLAAAIVATPSKSYANPAVSLAAVFANGPVALSSTTVAAYLCAEVAGALAAFAVVSLIYPVSRSPRRFALTRVAPDSRVAR